MMMMMMMMMMVMMMMMMMMMMVMMMMMMMMMMVMVMVMVVVMLVVMMMAPFLILHFREMLQINPTDLSKLQYTESSQCFLLQHLKIEAVNLQHLCEE